MLLIGSPQLNRREWLSSLVLASGVLLTGFGILGCNSVKQEAHDDSFEGWRFIGNVEFANESDLPLDTPLWTELDGRLYSDISSLTPNDFVTPTENFYIRTRASQLLSYRKSWQVQVTSAERQWILDVKEIVAMSKPLGVHLMECAGNSRPGHFGLISVADWVGVPVLRVLDRYVATKRSSRIQISGFDTYKTKTDTSVPGASWVFSLKDLESCGAFFAIEMNGKPLVPDHGAPVRLVVPGWYGCSCIKWVNEVVVVHDDVPATSQMQEYAGRTHQIGVPALASEYEPATIDPAAVPIRVEEWVLGRRTKYRIVGIVWGGSEIAKSLKIRIDEQPLVEVETIAATDGRPWAIWSHSWTPRRVGTYAIRLKIGEAGVRTRRLDSGFYTRTVLIKDI